MWSKIKKEVRHNQFLVAAMFLAGVLMFWVYGCESQTVSVLTPTQKVTRLELQTEVDTFNLKVKAAVADLDKQDTFKQEIVTVGVAIAEAGGISPAGVGVGVMLLGLVGLTADNRKKNSIIKTLKNTNGGTTDA
jgi:hypothetical protein